MITLRKLMSLKPKTRLRKIARILDSIEKQWYHESAVPDSSYFSGLLKILSEFEKTAPQAAIAAADFDLFMLKGGGNPGLDGKNPGKQQDSFGRYCNRIRHALLRDLGEEPAEWDFSPPFIRSERTAVDTGSGLNLFAAAASRPCVFPLSVYLEDLRSPFNVGSIFRTAEAFGMEKIYLSRDCADPEHSRAKRASMGAVDLIPSFRMSIEELRNVEVPVFALELGGTNIDSFRFPPNGIMILGTEELGTTPEAMKIASDSWGVASIPLYGAKGSLNVAVAFGIAISRWTADVVSSPGEGPN